MVRLCLPQPPFPPYVPWFLIYPVCRSHSDSFWIISQKEVLYVLLYIWYIYGKKKFQEPLGHHLVSLSPMLKHTFGLAKECLWLWHWCLAQTKFIMFRVNMTGKKVQHLLRISLRLLKKRWSWIIWPVGKCVTCVWSSALLALGLHVFSVLFKARTWNQRLHPFFRSASLS